MGPGSKAIGREGGVLRAAGTQRLPSARPPRDLGHNLPPGGRTGGCGGGVAEVGRRWGRLGGACGRLDVLEQPEAVGAVRLGPRLDRDKVKAARAQLRLLVVLRLGGLPQRAHAREQVLRVEADLEHNLARLEYRLDEGEVHAGEPRGDGGGSLREDRDAWHHHVRRERLLGQRAERAEANVLLRDRAALRELGVWQRHERVLLAAQLLRQLDGQLDRRRLWARLAVAGQRRVHLALALFEPLVQPVRDAARLAAHPRKLAQRDRDHVLHLRAEEPDRPRLDRRAVD
mmetsp:Transcript_36684/g.62985  ORF Transcript_36684/g.62985 Transcript_36684/m.62985 type:complete len:287 (-) Transcript_36684:258-1118(-)|eukprot:CAMPEP_0206168920 /NCGR_PEP_ID=MMETSP1474-20131121/33931_1 /ASSEMBLY_ACC=CAM_ASM_001110 /TAXON_ID=97495 /ORGANISM="Imantonia sp., Strain RCC918" /LENGTH=286 /DNA_ID=CAMNT_0053574593 /DNA_START=159 /DNA_END=1019 /DNA_ORIENTATION=+